MILLSPRKAEIYSSIALDSGVDRKEIDGAVLGAMRRQKTSSGQTKCLMKIMVLQRYLGQVTRLLDSRPERNTGGGNKPQAGQVTQGTPLLNGSGLLIDMLGCVKPARVFLAPP